MVGQDSLGKKYKYINQHVKRRKFSCTQWEMHTTYTFVPLCEGSPVFGGSHHIIINYADKFPYKLFQPQLLMYLRGETWSPLRRRMSRELSFQENGTYGTVWGREHASKHANIHACKGKFVQGVEIQLHTGV
jgi:hypothetical protein